MAAIPDFPSDVKILIHREREVEKEILYEDDEVVKESDMLGYEGSTRGNQGQKTNTTHFTWDTTAELHHFNTIK